MPDYNAVVVPYRLYPHILARFCLVAYLLTTTRLNAALVMATAKLTTPGSSLCTVLQPTTPTDAWLLWFPARTCSPARSRRLRFYTVRTAAYAASTTVPTFRMDVMQRTRYAVPVRHHHRRYLLVVNACRGQEDLPRDVNTRWFWFLWLSTAYRRAVCTDQLHA